MITYLRVMSLLLKGSLVFLKLKCAYRSTPMTLSVGTGECISQKASWYFHRTMTVKQRAECGIWGDEPGYFRGR